MALLVIAFNIIFWRWLKETLYLAYAGYVAINLVAYAFSSGYAQVLLPDWPQIFDQLQKALVLSQYAATGWFFGKLLRLRRQSPRFYRFNRNASIAWLVIAVATVIGLPFQGAVYFPLGFAHISAILALTCWLLWRGRRELLAYVAAFLALYLSNGLLTACSIGLLNANQVDYLPIFASAAHMVLINIGLAQRARKAEDARRAAEQVTLSMSLHNERELEARVIQRTRALEEANRALQSEVTERTELQGQLRSALAKEREAMAAQRQFVAMVSHEFRTPLAIIDATAQRVLLQHAPEAETLSAPLAKIRRAVQRLNGLIDTFLGEERHPSQGHEVAQETLDLYALAHTCAEQHRPLATGQIDCQASSTEAAVIGDGALMALILSSLVDNAIKYSPAGSPVSLKVGSDEQRGWVDVTDHGAGIAEADHERVFDKHVRLGTVTGVGGTGLGLYIARNAARRMGGNIELDSEPGKGSRFRLWLPRAHPGLGDLLPQTAPGGTPPSRQ
jgi:signal transduction histidine kinase